MLRDHPWVSGRLAAALGGALALAAAGCSDEPAGAGPHTPAPAAAAPDVGEGGPVNLPYVCGNRFLVTSRRNVPIQVTYRVEGSTEEGMTTLPAAPRMDPAISEQAIEVRSTGTVQLYLDGQFVVGRANAGMPCGPDAEAGPALASLSAGDEGEWSAPFSWPNVSVHMTLLPDGRILSVPRLGTPQVWDPATGAFTAVPPPAWLFCAGHALLSDGRVLVVGGHIDYDYGLPNTTLFTPRTTSWTSSTPMAHGRWYPTATTLANGDVLILAGRDEASQNVTAPEIWSNGSIRQLTTALKAWPYYPRAFQTAAGTVFIAGQTVYSHFLTTSGTGKLRTGPRHLFATARDYGSAVMYEDGKILYAGGARTTNTAETIDLNAATPAWTWTASMAYARRHLNLTVLPTGEVLATGGVSGTSFDDLTRGVFAAELWSPTTGQWTTLASNTVLRDYHSTALLLPDGRVLVGGGSEKPGSPDHANAEIYSPPYLFHGPRPVISSAPASARYGEQFRVLTPDAASITRVALIRLASVTHAFDQNTRSLRAMFTADATGLTVTAPSSGNRAPPGHYMLFIVNGNRVPSVATIVRIY